MNFEDIVDMDWLNSHTTDSLPSPPTTLIEDDELMLQYPNCANEFDYCSPTSVPIMPTTEQIKQLIELAKRQLALREQLTVDNLVTSEPTPEPESPPPTIKLEEFATVSPESLVKTEDRRDSFASISDEGPMSLEAYAETDGIDIKKLTSKERRQLRNKISARNFRVRRKEYITTLEGQVDNHKKANEQLLHRLNTVEEENKQLKMQIDTLKRQNGSLKSPSPNKDISILGSSPSDTYFLQDTSILVEC
ncbi:uncharacterized protein EV154DRAFT_518381 [Mucor mucedo]|uniref:BZIP domain-containing protein n=1 Tax=Mucor saturninus TaxID=64648 RepID=A0A8H7RAJ7_9FUNG|nr:uncharacterized protein EV154DRAFT_518381 [Mucor mucedo]KAG2206730.1 hypothetical protein INT47_003672 [Mucor saturninus]KAI7888234.1 hypothetical protein EV154DRAFT_518381 [Mucor mucedo]